MGKVIIALGGGGGIDPDEYTADRPQVLEGYMAGVHGEDEPAPGSMPERGNWVGNVGMNGMAAIPDGHHGGGGYVSGPAVTQRGNLDKWLAVNETYNLPEGYYTGGTVRQSLPVQNADVPGTDRARCTAASAWEQTMTLGVRNGHYLDGVNWIQADLPGLQAGNIRQGTNIGGLVGTMVDYSYLAVNQVPFDGASFSGVMAEGAQICWVNPNGLVFRDAPVIDASGIHMHTSTATNAYPHFCPKKSIDFSPFREVQITGHFSGITKGKGYFQIELWNTDVDRTLLLWDRLSPIKYSLIDLDAANVNYVCSIDVSGISGQMFMTVEFTNNAGLEWLNYFINRIEFIT